MTSIDFAYCFVVLESYTTRVARITSSLRGRGLHEDLRMMLVSMRVSHRLQ